MDNPSAVTSGDIIAIAYQEKRGIASRILGLAIAPVDGEGRPGPFTFKDIVREEDKFILPFLVDTGDGFQLLWLTSGPMSYGHGRRLGDLYRVILDREGNIVERPYIETLSPCSRVNAAWSGRALGMACLEEDEQGLVLKVGAAMQGSRALQVTVIDECDDGISLPALLWDGEAFDVLYECYQESDHGELKLAKFSEAGEILADAAAVDSWDGMLHKYFLPAPGVHWTGSEIALVWHSFGGEGSVTGRFATLGRDGTFFLGPFEMDLGEELAGDLGLAPTNGGYLVSSSVCDFGLETESAWFKICAIDPSGSPAAGCIRGSEQDDCGEGLLPVSVSIVSNESWARFFFEDFFESSGKSTIFQSALDPASMAISEPEPLKSPAGDAIPLSLTCDAASCRLLAHDEKARFQDDPPGDYVYRWFILDREGGLVETYVSDLSSAARYTTVAKGEGGMGVLWQEERSEDMMLSFLGVDGGVKWTLNVESLIGSLYDVSMFMEQDRLRIFHPCASWEEICHTWVGLDGSPGESRTLSGMPYDSSHGYFITDAGGIYFGYDTIASTMGTFAIYRLDPAEGDAFIPFAAIEGVVGSLFLSDALVGGIAHGRGDVASIFRWDMSGRLLGGCLIDDNVTFHRYWESGMGEDLAILLDSREYDVVPLKLIKLGASGAGKVYDLDLPGSSEYELDILSVTVEAGESELRAAWLDMVSGDLYISVWPIQD